MTEEKKNITVLQHDRKNCCYEVCRGYYRCNTPKGSPAKKQVKRSNTDSSMLIITYTSTHNHPALTVVSPTASLFLSFYDVDVILLGCVEFVQEGWSSISSTLSIFPLKFSFDNCEYILGTKIIERAKALKVNARIEPDADLGLVISKHL
ncbi:hypothetical protein RYX36_002058 [Vicia faba]